MLVMREGGKGKATLAGRLAETLRREILEGSLEPGARLNLDRMRDRLHVSVGSLREAVTRLVADGLIVAEEQKGYLVAPISLADLSEVTRLRMELEPLALAAAIESGGLDWETNVMAALYRLNHTAREPDDVASVEAWENAHEAFHMALIAASGMPLLLRIHRQLMAMSERYRRILPQGAGGWRDVSGEHSLIAEAATARDTAEATRLLRAHIERNGEKLRCRIDGGGDAAGPGART